MQIKPIKTADDNRAALARIEQLWDAETNYQYTLNLEIFCKACIYRVQKSFPEKPHLKAVFLNFFSFNVSLSRVSIIRDLHC